jgi:hypothetical protein
MSDETTRRMDFEFLAAPYLRNKHPALADRTDIFRMDPDGSQYALPQTQAAWEMFHLGHKLGFSISQEWKDCVIEALDDRDMYSDKYENSPHSAVQALITFGMNDRIKQLEDSLLEVIARDGDSTAPITVHPHADWPGAERPGALEQKGTAGQE